MIKLRIKLKGKMMKLKVVMLYYIKMVIQKIKKQMQVKNKNQ